MDKELDKSLHKVLDAKHKTLEENLNKKISGLGTGFETLNNDLRKLFKV